MMEVEDFPVYPVKVTLLQDPDNYDIPVILDPEIIVSRARKRFLDGCTKSLKFRKIQLKSLLRMLQENEQSFTEALYKDLRKPHQESVCYEVRFLCNEIVGMLRNFEKWAKPEKPTKPLAFLLDGVEIHKDPYGVVLVIGSWNYPLQLTLSPAIGAIAAGNCVIFKPSEISRFTSKLLQELIPKYLDSECYPVFPGGIPETSRLLTERFDYIFFTGATEVGRIVHRAANRYLTPVTLEMGGKSPVFIDESADLQKTVKRILWGKFINAGQTCVAPDYILCTRGTQERFVTCAEKVLPEFFRRDAKKSNDFCRIVNERHFSRLLALMKDLKIVLGGGSNKQDLYIEPTIAVDVISTHPIMQEEIFGPILPILTVESAEQAIEFINHREKPLALYVFTKRANQKKMFLSKTSSGGVTVNDTILHLSVDCLPFGGVGSSGMGAYHGRASFDTFVHQKSVLVKSFRSIPEKITSCRYPPYSKFKTNLMLFGTKNRPELKLEYFAYFAIFLMGFLVAFGVYVVLLYCDIDLKKSLYIKT